MTRRLGSVGQRCPPVSGEGSGQGGMLMSDSHYCRAVTTSTSRIHPSPHTGRTSRQTRRPHCGGGPLNNSQHRRATSPLTTRTVRWVDSIPDSTWEEKEVEDSRRRSIRNDSAGKEVVIEDKSQVEKEMPPCPEREAVHRQPRWSQFFPGPHTGVV
ncbi:hypothetical protein PoB_006029200 [Plakobranchus ocellatus]|uniref:Uncharacterized protein n=1 Tax=Plakobranchus ocellatus TaxID=259542 RepID=A0AAV4CPI5_9GAST|nr:hypothetical protein PoB_006029200 [Plakobranchus ocellatus]